MMKTFAAATAVALMIAGSASAQQQPQHKPAAAAAKPAAAPTEDRYVGYYYPKPTSTEVFESAMQTIDGVDRAQRIQFTTVVSQGTIQSAYRVPYAWLPQVPAPGEIAITPPQPGTFRVPGSPAD